MFILDLTYTAPLSLVESHIEPHMEWVAKGYDDGLFLASGRKEPRTGGLIIARGNREELEAFAATDPFVIAGVAHYEITQLQVSRTAEGLEGLKA